MPSGEDLPDELNALSRQHALTIRDDRWHLDVALLIRTLEEHGIRKRNRVSLALLAVVVLALIAVFLLTWYFFTRQMVVNPAADGKFSVPAAILGTHEVIIEGAKLESPPANLGTYELALDGAKLENAELLLLHQAPPTEEVQVEIERARISQETVGEYKIDPRSSQTFNYVNYAPAAPDQDSVSERRCNTLLEVSLKDKTQAVAIHFYQEIDPEGGARDLKMKVSGAELFVNMETTAESEDDALGEGRDDGLGCWKDLLVGSLVNDRRYGVYAVTGVVAADSEIQFRFTPLLKTPLWEGREGPFAFGSLKAQAVTIRSSKGEIVYNIRCVDEASLLRIDSLAVDSKQLRLTVSGDKAFATIHGEDGVGFRERIHRIWGRMMLLAIVTIFLGVWLTVSFEGSFAADAFCFSLLPARARICLAN